MKIITKYLQYHKFKEVHVQISYNSNLLVHIEMSSYFVKKYIKFKLFILQKYNLIKIYFIKFT